MFRSSAHYPSLSRFWTVSRAFSEARLRVCLALSLLIHASLVLLLLSLPNARPSAPPPVFLTAQLLTPAMDLPPPVEPQVPVVQPVTAKKAVPSKPVKPLTKPPVVHREAPTPKPKDVKSAETYSTASKKTKEPVLKSAELASFYPEPYVQSGVEGEVLLRLSVDPVSGRVLAAKVETPSPFILFNEAARQAALSLLPVVPNRGVAEAFLPIKFRLGR